jgi:hypothetical protein
MQIGLLDAPCIQNTILMFVFLFHLIAVFRFFGESWGVDMIFGIQLPSVRRRGHG